MDFRRECLDLGKCAAADALGCCRCIQHAADEAFRDDDDDSDNDLNLDLCHHGVPFDEDCVDCIIEAVEEGGCDFDEDPTQPGWKP